MSGDFIEAEGVVVEACRDLFTVEIELAGVKRRVLAKRSGRLNQFRIRITPGDTVQLELSPYDLGRARITYRGKRAAGA